MHHLKLIQKKLQIGSLGLNFNRCCSFSLHECIDLITTKRTADVMLAKLP